MQVDYWVITILFKIFMHRTVCMCAHTCRCLWQDVDTGHVLLLDEPGVHCCKTGYGVCGSTVL